MGKFSVNVSPSGHGVFLRQNIPALCVRAGMLFFSYAKNDKNMASVPKFARSSAPEVIPVTAYATVLYSVLVCSL